MPARARANRWNPAILATALAVVLVLGIPALALGISSASSASASDAPGSAGYTVDPYGYGTAPGGSASGQTDGPAEPPTTGTAAVPPTAPPTHAAPPTDTDSTPTTPAADLGLAEPITRLGCTGDYAVFVGAAVEPSSYTADVQRLLGQHPGSSYLFTQDNCTSLRSHADNGNAIYAIFYGPYTTSEEACARKSAVGGGAYVRRLDNVTPPGKNVCGR